MIAYRFGLVLGLALGSAVLLGACGGDVTATGSAAGAGGAGGAASTAASTGTGPDVSGAEACADICHKLETNNCGANPQDCSAFCEGQFADAGPCADELGSLYACWVKVAPDCPTKAPPECKAEEDTYEACDAVYGCMPGECSGSAGPNGEMDCGCTQVCAMKEYKTSCATDAMGTNCECFVDNASVGMCKGAGDSACGINDGCCAPFFKK